MDKTWKPAQSETASSPVVDGYNPGPIVPLDAIPSISFDRSMNDQTQLEDVQLLSPYAYSGPTTIGEYTFDYNVKTVRLEKWSKAGGAAWDPVTDLYAAWLAVEDYSTQPVAVKLQLYTHSPFAFTRQTSRLYRDTFLANHLGWPCGEVPQPQSICISWEEEQLDTSYGPVFTRGGLIFSLEHAASVRPADSNTCHTGHGLFLQNGDNLWVVFPEPVRTVSICLARGAFLSGQAYANGVQVDHNLVVNGMVVFKGQRIDALRLNKAANVYLAQLCYETEALASEMNSVQEYLDSLAASTSRWSSAEQILEPETWYRLTVELETVRTHNGEDEPVTCTHYATFQTSGPSGLAPTTAVSDAELTSPAAALSEPPYPVGGQLTTAAPYLQSSIPGQGAVAVYRAYDLGAEFNESYVEQMYGADMRVRLLDRNGLPVLDESGNEVLFANQWGQMPTSEISETDLPYLTRIQDCLAQSVESLPPNQKITFTNGLLLDDDFSGGLENWTDPSVEDGDPHLNWTIAVGQLQWNGATLPVWGALLVAGDEAWGDYAVEVDLSRTGSEVGLVFRYSQAESECYYRLRLDGGGRRLERVVDGVPSALWEDTIAYIPGKTGTLGVQCLGVRLRGQADGELLFDLEDSGGFVTGRVGIYANATTAFERFLVREWPGSVLAAQEQYSAELLASFVLYQGGLLNGWTDRRYAWKEWSKNQSHLAVLGRKDWDNYRLELNVSGVTRQTGLIVRFQEQDGSTFRCYRLLLNPDEQSLRLARLDGTLDGETYDLQEEDKAKLWGCAGSACRIDFALLEHTLALTCQGTRLMVEVDGLELADLDVQDGLVSGQAGLFYNADTPPIFSDLVVRSAPRAPVHHWSFITSRYAGLVEHLDSCDRNVYPLAVSGIDLSQFTGLAAAATEALKIAADNLTACRAALSAAGQEELAALRLKAEQAAAKRNATSAAQFEVLWELLFQSGYRPLPPGVEITAIVQKNRRLALLLESPEPLDWTRLTVGLEKYHPASNGYRDQGEIQVIWNEDCARALILRRTGGPIADGDYRLHFEFSLDLGPEAPLLRRSGSSLPEAVAILFQLDG